MFEYKYPKNYFITRRPILTKVPDHLIFSQTIKYSSGIEEEYFTAVSAKRYSQQLGLEGRFHVDASSLKQYEYAPHVFYKKYGMNTGRPSIDKKLDLYIQKRKNATALDFKVLTMFYPPIQYEVKDKTPFLKRIMKAIYQFFSLTNRIKV